VAEQNGVAAVDRALSLLGAFRADDYSLTLTELAQRTGMYKSTALRLIESLVRANYLKRIADGSYQLGAKPFELGAIYQRQLRTAEIVPPILRRVAQALSESASYYVLERDGRLCLHRVDADRMIRDSIREGDWRPLEGGATGTILMAFRGDPGEELDTVRKALWAASFGGADPEMAAVAVPVFGPGQVLMGALSASGPRYRFERAGARSMVPTLMAATRELTRLLGGDATVFEEKGGSGEGS
jgi:DNA-binding IclR family transcriptional regulator